MLLYINLLACDVDHVGNRGLVTEAMPPGLLRGALQACAWLLLLAGNQSGSASADETFRFLSIGDWGTGSRKQVRPSDSSNTKPGISEMHMISSEGPLVRLVELSRLMALLIRIDTWGRTVLYLCVHAMQKLVAKVLGDVADRLKPKFVISLGDNIYYFGAKVRITFSLSPRNTYFRSEGMVS